VSRYGPLILEDQRQLDRKKLRDIIFANHQERLWLEHLLHPQVRQQLAQDVAQCSSLYCIVEIPLLYNRKQYPYLHRVLLITSTIEIQVKRITTRDQCTEEQALSIIATQQSIEERSKTADDIVVNNDDLHYLLQETDKLHHKYLNLSKNT
jgi:dephospho-CoA kinase